MKYIEKYPNCIGCPVTKYCGTMISTARLCNSYGNATAQPIENKVEPKIVYKYDNG